MKRLALVLGLVALLATAMPGCQANRCPHEGPFGNRANAGRCPGQGIGDPSRRYVDPSNCYNGPPSAAVAYPYYTLHGPRDFLSSSPPSIGP